MNGVNSWFTHVTTAFTQRGQDSSQWEVPAAQQQVPFDSMVYSNRQVNQVYREYARQNLWVKIQSRQYYFVCHAKYKYYGWRKSEVMIKSVRVNLICVIYNWMILLFPSASQDRWLQVKSGLFKARGTNYVRGAVTTYPWRTLFFFSL